MAECFPRKRIQTVQHQVLQALVECLHILDLAQNQLLKQGEHLTITVTYLYLSYHCLILSYCLGNPPSTLIGTGTQQVFRCAAQLPPRLVCRKGRFCLSHIGGRQASKANVSGGSRVNLHRLGACIVQAWHSSLMKYL